MENNLKSVIEVNDVKYDLYFNLNVMQEIQEEYKTLDKWAELTDGTKGEVDIKALIFGVYCMINEGIDISNEENNEKKPFMTKKQVGRLITELGVKEMTTKVNDAVIKSTKSDEKN